MYRSGVAADAAGKISKSRRMFFQIVAVASVVGAAEYRRTTAVAAASALSCCIGVGVVLVPAVFAIVCFFSVAIISVAAVAAPENSTRTILTAFVADPLMTIQSCAVAYGAVALIAYVYVAFVPLLSTTEPTDAVPACNCTAVAAYGVPEASVLFTTPCCATVPT